MRDHRYIDITLALRAGLPIWPGHPALEIEPFRNIASGASSNLTRLSMSVHTGTHVDAPRHFFDGEAGVESLRLESMLGRAYVVNLTRVERVTSAELERARVPSRTRRLLIRTRNSEYWSQLDTVFHEDFVGLDASAASWIVAHHIQLVGVDYLSVAPWKEGRPTHEILLRAGVTVVEGLNLQHVKAGRYRLLCLPLNIAGSDGAPARVVLERLGGNR
jgi:arylformamidase